MIQIGLLVSSSLVLLLLAGLIKESLQWRHLKPRPPFGAYLVTSPYYLPLIAVMLLSFSIQAQLEPSFPLPWWLTLPSGVVFLGIYAATFKQQREKRQTLSQHFDERSQSIARQSDQLTLWLIGLYLFGRAIAYAATAPNPSLIHNPWLQTAGLLLVVNIITSVVLNRRYS